MPFKSGQNNQNFQGKCVFVSALDQGSFAATGHLHQTISGFFCSDPVCAVGYKTGICLLQWLTTSQ